MTCSTCNGKGHNKRGYPNSDRVGVGSSTSAAKPSGSGRGRGRPKKQTTKEGEPTVKRGRGRPKKTTSVAANASAANPSNVAEFPSTSTHHSLGSWFSCSAPNTTPNSPANPFAAADTIRGREKGTHHSLESWLSCSTPNSYDAPSASAATRGRGRGVGTPYKRPRVMGMDVFQAENGFTTINPRMPSRRIVSTGSTRITNRLM